MPSVIKVDQIQSDTGTVNLTSNVAFSGSASTMQIGNALYLANTNNFALQFQPDVAGRLRIASSVSSFGDNNPFLIERPSSVGIQNDAITIRSGGVVDLGKGQLKFPASQNASSDPNTLDDYEEGTWTPAIAPSSGGSITLKNISARYTKVGRMINVWFTAQVNTVSSPTGRMGLTGLPFATSSTPIGGVCLINGFNTFSGHTGTLIEASTTANMDRYNSGGIQSDLASYAAVNGYIFFNVTYDIV